MSDIFGMKVAKNLKELLKNSFNFFFRKLPIWLRFQICMKGLPLHHFHDEVDDLRSVNSFVKLNDIRMVKF